MGHTGDDGWITTETLEFIRERLENRNFAISRQFIPVEYGGSACLARTEDEQPVIMVPTPKKITTGEISFLYAMQIHESAHVLFTPFIHKRVFEKFSNPPLARELYNILEDARVNYLVSITHPGAASLMHQEHKRIVRDVISKRTSEFSSRLPVLVSLALACGYVEFEEVEELKLKSIEEKKKAIEKTVSILREAQLSYEPDISWKLLPVLCEIWYEDLRTGVPEGMRTNTRGVYPDERAPLCNPSEMDISKNLERVRKLLERKGEKEGEESEEAVFWGVSEGTAAPGSSLIDGELRKEVRETVRKARLIQKLTTATVDSADNVIDERPLSYVDLSEKEEYEKYRRELKPYISQLVSYIKTLKVLGRRAVNGKRYGRIGKKPYRIITDKNPNIFLGKDVGRTQGISVVVLVDNSGSMMCGSNMENAIKASILIHEALRKTGIKHMIVGYTADEGRAGLTNHIIYKGWEDIPTPAYHLVTMSPLNQNRDDKSILRAKEYFKGITGKKILIVISDGAPEAFGFSGKPAVNKTIEAQKEVMKCGIRIINLGVEYDMPEGYINKIGVQNFERLPKTMFKVLRKEVRI